MRDFGNPYRLVDPGVAIKKHPSQYGTHRGIDAALDLRGQYSVDPSRIASVKITTVSMPYIDRPRPDTGLAGKFSFQYTVAVALLDGVVTAESFSDQRRFSLDAEDLLGKVELQMDPNIPADFDGMWTSVEVHNTNGQSHVVRCDRPRGIWGRPLTREERLTKFRRCALLVLDPGAVDRCIELVERLDEANGLQELIYLMSTARVKGGSP